MTVNYQDEQNSFSQTWLFILNTIFSIIITTITMIIITCIFYVLASIINVKSMIGLNGLRIILIKKFCVDF